MEFRVLGPFEVVDGERVLLLGSGRQLALVAVLVLHANEPVTVDRLVEELWDGAPPATAAKIVRNAVSVLRKELGDRLVTHPPGYLLRVGADELDSARLEHAVETGDRTELTDALALWRGPPLSQFAYERFAQAEIVRLEELRLSALEARLDAELALGGHAAAVPELESLAQQHPLRERLCGQLMLALYRSGRQAEALDVYRRTRQRLDEELGIEPAPELRKLERQILNQDASLEPRGAPTTTTTPFPPARRRHLGRAAVAALVVAAVVAAALLAAQLRGGDSQTLAPNQVGAIDPQTNKLVAALPVGIRPGPLASGAGALWVGNLADRNLTRIDPRRRAVTGAVSLGDRTPTGLTVSAGSVWVAHGPSGELSRVEARFGRVAKTIAVTERPYASPTGAVAVGGGFVWVVYGDSTLARIEPRTTMQGGSTLVGSSPTAVAVGAGFVWVANGGDATVERFHAATFEQGPAGRAITVGRQPAALALAGDALWVANRGDDTVTRIDVASRSAITVPVGNEPVAVATGAGAVWVANRADGTVSRIDAITRRVVRTVEVGGAPAGIAVAAGLVWVSVQTP